MQGALKAGGDVPIALRGIIMHDFWADMTAKLAPRLTGRRVVPGASTDLERCTTHRRACSSSCTPPQSLTGPAWTRARRHLTRRRCGCHHGRSVTS